MSIEISGLTKTFSSAGIIKNVLNNINLKAEKGEILSLMGRNGAGKTTLLKIIASLIVPDSGEITLNDIDLRKKPEEFRKKIGIVYNTEHTFYQNLSVKENLQFYSRLFAVKNKVFITKLNYLMEVFQLPSALLENRLAHCSSGTKHKLAIIRALLPEPELILIDELSRSLDAESEKNISKYLRKFIDSEKKISIIVTHNISWAEEFCNTVWRLENTGLRKIK